MRNLFKTASTLALLGFLASCSQKGAGQNTADQSKFSANIIGGKGSSLDYQKQNGIVGLLMVYKDQKGEELEATCTGSLISKNVVLSAAHCLLPPPDAQLVVALVVFGNDFSAAMDQLQKKDASAVRRVDKGHINADYLKNGETSPQNDISMVRFVGEAPADFSLATLPTIQNTAALQKGAHLTLAGYGVSEYGMDPNTHELAGSGSGVLRQIDGIEVVSLSAQGEEIVLDQSKGIGACHGDSGGPAYLIDPTSQKNILVGVTSRTTATEGLCNTGVVYTGVLAYSQWIEEGLKLMAIQ